MRANKHYKNSLNSALRDAAKLQWSLMGVFTGVANTIPHFSTR